MATHEDADPFDTILSLEDQYYAEGHALGVKDGSKAGRVEGRLFGMQKGFEKFAAMGSLAAQGAVWDARMNSSSVDVPRTISPQNDSIPAIPQNERLRKHIATLLDLTEYDSIDTNNSEEAVIEFDDRLKRGESKAKVISSILGEQNQTGNQSQIQASQPSRIRQNAQNSNMEDFGLPNRGR
ncbi:DUF1715-domain-containing protein [Myriangium duriaei CBS 260.36]|uniref:DUF1715-domain-containing protein n=1 Tax=Myriangium duriaei CBS 260.36 TaxID=1168546 RepID=A0A9P4IZ57_9PEZI|nr:DUF1715-domain-containing protein [Myriangium duriaei CBS 260.36]